MRYSLKKILKSNECIYNINAYYKGYVLDKESDKLNEQFKDKKERSVHENLASIRNKVSTLPRKGRLRVLWVGASREQDYSGFIQGLRKYFDVIDFEQKNGEYGLKLPLGKKGLFHDEEREVNSSRLLELVGEESQGIDIVMGQMWANSITAESLNKIRSQGIVVINIAMDDKLPDHWKRSKSGTFTGSIGLSTAVDLTLNTFSDAVRRYNSIGANCIYWPLASSAEIFNESKQKEYDVSFVGSNYGYRGQIITALKKKGINVAAFGPGFESGMISATKTADIFSKSKIILGMGHISYSKNITTLKLRDFDAMFTGALYVTSENESLQILFKDSDSIIYYSNIDSLVKKINYYLDNDLERIRIANNALKLSKSKHSWDIRIKSLIDMIYGDKHE